MSTFSIPLVFLIAITAFAGGYMLAYCAAVALP
jgi:hypothetical protein